MATLTIQSHLPRPCLEDPLVHFTQHGGSKEGILTDVVIESEQGAGELCTCVSLLPLASFASISHSPLSPFIITQIREPTHLSISSIEGLAGSHGARGIRERTERQKLGGHCDWYVGNQEDTRKLSSGNSSSRKKTQGEQGKISKTTLRRLRKLVFSGPSG